MTCPKVAFPSASADPFTLRLSIPILAFSMPAGANDVDIVDASSSCDGTHCRFEVTLAHQDTGWDHYADYWRVVTESGDELGRRVLLHPHENEQPFTRSLDHVPIPDGIREVWIEAHDSVHGTAAKRFHVILRP